MVFSVTRDQIEFVLSALSTTAGKDPVMDNFHRGYIQGMRDLLEIDFQGVNEDD